MLFRQQSINHKANIASGDLRDRISPLDNAKGSVTNSVQETG